MFCEGPDIALDCMAVPDWNTTFCPVSVNLELPQNSNPLFIIHNFHVRNKNVCVLLPDPTWNLRSCLCLETPGLKRKGHWQRESPRKVARVGRGVWGPLLFHQAHSTRAGSGVWKFSVCPAPETLQGVPGLQSSSAASSQSSPAICTGTQGSGIDRSLQMRKLRPWDPKVKNPKPFSNLVSKFRTESHLLILPSPSTRVSFLSPLYLLFPR